MPESHRRGELGSYYHVMGRGLDRKPILGDDRDRALYLRILAEVLSERGARCFAFALIPNHHHLVLQSVQRPVSSVMHALHRRFARAHNRRHDGTGHVFEGPYRSRLIGDLDHLLTALAYVHLNPVRAGLVRDLEALADYPWTGHSALMGRREAPFLEVDSVLGWFGGSVRDARREVVRLLTRVLGQDPGPAPSDPLWTPHGEVALPRREAEDLRSRGVIALRTVSGQIDAAERERTRAILLANWLRAAGWDRTRLLAWVCETIGADVQAVQQGRRTAAESRARAVYAFAATAWLGVAASEVARDVGVSSAAVARARERGRRILQQLSN